MTVPREGLSDRSLPPPSESLGVQRPYSRPMFDAQVLEDLLEFSCGVIGFMWGSVGGIRFGFRGVNAHFLKQCIFF